MPCLQYGLVHGFVHFHITAFRMLQLSPDLRRDLVMGLCLAKLQQCFLLFGTNMAFVSLDKGEECLMPQHRQFSGLTLKLQEVKDDSVHHSIGQGILLVEENSQKDAVRATVLHFGNHEHYGRAVQDRDRMSGQDTANDDSLSQGAIAALTEGKKESFEKGSRFEERLVDRLIQMEVQPLIVIDVVSYAREQELVEKPLCLLLPQVGGEDPRRLIHGGSRPVFRLGQEQKVLPISELSDDFKGLGNLATAILGQHFSDTLIHFDNSRIQLASLKTFGIRVLCVDFSPFLRNLLSNDVSQSPSWPIGTVHETLKRSFIFLVQVVVLLGFVIETGVILEIVSTLLIRRIFVAVTIAKSDLFGHFCLGSGSPIRFIFQFLDLKSSLGKDLLRQLVVNVVVDSVLVFPVLSLFLSSTRNGELILKRMQSSSKI